MPREALLPLVFGRADATLEESGLVAAGGGTGDDVDRRTFGSVAAGAVAAVVLPDVTIPRRVTASHIRYLRACADSLHNRDQIVGGGGVLRQALRQWHRARRMLDEADYTEEAGRELMSAAGGLAVRAAWASYDNCQQGLARQLYSEAILLADQAGDDALAVHAVTNMSLQAVNLAGNGRPGPAREALRLSGRATDLARRNPSPQLHALIAARTALAYALLGNSHSFQAAITRAWREMEREPAADGPVWLRFVVPAEITVHEARGHAYLGNFGAAAALCRQSLENSNLSPRNRACYHAQLVAALAGDGDAASAVDEGLAVLRLVEKRVTSERVLRDLRQVRSAAEQIGAEEFCARFDKAACATVA